MPAVRRSKFLELFWRAHRWLYQTSGGRLGSRLLGKNVLLLTTTGRKTGRTRTNTLYYLEDGNRYVVIASNAGDARHPGWYHNLMAEPRALVQAGRIIHQVRARRAEGEERAALWAEAVRMDPSYEEYRQRTTREIPVVILVPVEGT